MTLTKQVQALKKEPPATSFKSRVEYDIIRLFATFSVIAVHVGTPVVNNFNSSSSDYWWTGNVYEAIFRSGIPLFLMLTGALLLPQANGFEFIKKKELRVLLPLSFWTLIYLVAKNPIKDIQVSGYFSGLYHGYSYHFWYVYMIMLIYILMPILRVVVQKLNPSTTSVFVFICFTTLVLKSVSVEQPVISNAIDYIIYIEYIVLGYCIATTKEEWWLKNHQFGLFLISIGFIITLFGTYYFSERAEEQDGFFYQSTTTHIFLKAVGVWIVLKHFSKKVSVNMAKHLRAYSKLSFGIFLIHPLVIDHVLAVRFGIWHNFTHPVIGILLTTVLCFVFSMFIIYFLSRLPLGKYTY